MRFYKHIGLQPAWDMRVGGVLLLACFWLVFFVRYGMVLFALLYLLCDCRPGNSPVITQQ